MKKILEYLPFYLVVSVAIGIYLNYNIASEELKSSGVFIYASLIVFLLFLTKRVNKRGFFFIILILSFVTIGYIAAHINNPKNFNSFYKNQHLENAITTIQIKEKLKSSRFSHKYIGKIVNVDNYSTKGNVLINIDKTSSEYLKIDQVLLTKPIFKSISPPLNPYQFDYRSYLAKKYVYEQTFLRKGEFKILKRHEYSIMGIAETIRFKIEKSLEKQSFSPEVLSVMKALLLGQRKEITKNTLANYTNAGVIHVLAISGLHLGILLMFINFISNPLLHVKNGKFVKVIIVVVILWSFAFISGLSASVARSATMFSFITIAKLFQKKTFSEYSIISSIFVLLLINPMDLFNIGFQLSYLAVFGIIWIYPLLFNLWTPKYFILMKLWQLTVVSISAQIAVLPLSIYYFHQFPMLFLISNLVIVSLLGFILISGILVILLSSVDALPEFIALSYDFIINKMNSFVQWISSFDQFVLKEISLNKLQTIIWYLIIIGCVRSLYRFKGRNFLFILIYSAFLQLSLIYEKYTTDKKDSLVIFHKTKQTIIGKQKGKEFTIYNNQKESNLTYLISPIKKNEDIKINYKNKLPDILRHKENIVLLINNSDFFAIEGLNKNVIVILTNSPKLNLDRFLQSNTPKMIIADGSNYRSYINKWQKTCKKQKTPFYSTEKNGAYILN